MRGSRGITAEFIGVLQPHEVCGAEGGSVACSLPLDDVEERVCPCWTKDPIQEEIFSSPRKEPVNSIHQLVVGGSPDSEIMLG